MVFFRRLFLIFFSLVLSQSLQAQWLQDARVYIPRLSSPQRLQNYLAYLQRMVPSAFESGGMYFVDPLRTVEKEQRFLSRLNTPEFRAIYLRELPTRKPFQAIHLDVKEEVLKPHPQFRPDALLELQGRFTEMANSFPTHENQIAALKSVITSLQGHNSQGLLTGMIQSLPNEQKGHAFALDFEEKLQYLETNLTDTALREKFRSQTLDVQTLTVAGLIADIRRLAQIEKQIGELSLFIYCTSKNAALSDQIFQEFDLHKNQEFLAELDISGSLKAKDILQSSVTALGKRSIAITQVPTLETKANFKIEELSPHLGQFRGTLNNDCFTTMAFGFVYSPAERTFVVKDSSGKILFSIYATEVQLNGEKTLYIHDMGSANVSPTVGEYAVRALYASKRKLGFKQLALGTKGMHHYQFQRALNDINQNTESHPITYLDADSREIIGDLMVEINAEDISRSGLNASYAKQHDLPSAHTSAVIFKPKARQTTTITATVNLQTPENLGPALERLPKAFSLEEPLPRPARVLRNQCLILLQR